MNFGLVTENAIKSELGPEEAEQAIALLTMLYDPLMDRIVYYPERTYLFEGTVLQGKFRLRYLGHLRGKQTMRPILLVP